MISLKKQQKGFTIIELLIVIVVIGILAAIVIITFSGIQERGRDTERQTDVNAVHSQLEAYFTLEGSYPTYDQLNSATFVSAELRGLDLEALKDPRAADPTGDATGIAAAVADNAYGYTVGPAGCDGTTTTPCTEYTLSANREGDGDPISKSNLN